MDLFNEINESYEVLKVNTQVVQRFEDGGHLTSTKLMDFRNQLRHVGPSAKTSEVAAPIIEEIKLSQQQQCIPKQLRVKPQAKKPCIPRTVNHNRPLPTPPVKKNFKKKPEEISSVSTVPVTPKTDHPDKECVNKNIETDFSIKEPEDSKLAQKEVIANKKIIDANTPKKPGVFTRSIHAIGNFAKKVFCEIKKFFESVFGKLFGRVTKIKIGNEEITFDGHNPSRVNSGVGLKIELDPKTANTMKTVTLLGVVAANSLPPPPPPLPRDGKIPVKDWRQEKRTSEEEFERKSTGPCIKEMVQKRRQEGHLDSMHNFLACGLAKLRNAQHLDEEDDDTSFFQVTFTATDGKLTDLSFDGDKTLEVRSEIVDQKPVAYNTLQKKHVQESGQKPINQTTIGEAMKKLKHVDMRKPTKQPAEIKIENVLLAAFQKNAAHLQSEEN